MIHPCADRLNPATGCLTASLAMLLFWGLVILMLAGCACPQTTYRAVPAWSVPAKPLVETVQAAALQCLDADTYLKLARRDRACWRYAGELRALLGPEE